MHPSRREENLARLRAERQAQRRKQMAENRRQQQMFLWGMLVPAALIIFILGWVAGRA